jgi:hypothetical protein
MHDPLALDRQRIDLERLRRRAESASQRQAPLASVDQEPASRSLHLLRRSHRRPAAAC